MREGFKLGFTENVILNLFQDLISKRPCDPKSSSGRRVRLGFTIAEVLITLGIIGVVAAMTIPTLMNNTQDKQFKTAAKKQYSAFSQAYTSIISDNGGSLAGTCTNADVIKERDCFASLFAEKMKFIKRCYAFDYSADNSCFTSKYTQMNKATYSAAGADGSAILADGSSAWFVLWYPDCDNSDYDSFAQTVRADFCGWIAFDVNGTAKPNTIGKDIYGVGIFSDSIKPYGAWGNFGDDCKTNQAGWTCLYNVMNNIPY